MQLNLELPDRVFQFFESDNPQLDGFLVVLKCRSKDLKALRL